MGIDHARAHVGDAARAIFDHTDLGAVWGHRWRDEPDRSGEADRLIEELQRHGQSALTEANYVKNSRKPMCSSEFRAQGMCVSSGVVAGACTLVVGTRLTWGGMHWPVDDATAIIALRCSLESSRCDDFWKRQVGAISQKSRNTRLRVLKYSAIDLFKWRQANILETRIP